MPGERGIVLFFFLRCGPDLNGNIPQAVGRFEA